MSPFHPLSDPDPITGERMPPAHRAPSDRHAVPLAVSRALLVTALGLTLSTSVLAGTADMPETDTPRDAGTDFLHPIRAGSVVTQAGESHNPHRSSRGAPWWEQDVWQDPDRPFLFYGAPKESRPERSLAHRPAEPAPVPPKPSVTPRDPDDFSSYPTVDALKTERERRLNVAIMDPSPANMAAYQAINAHMLGLSARFAAAWQLGRMLNPGYDFTSTHPSANFATAALADVNRETSRSLMASLATDAGLLFIGQPGDPLTEIAAGPVRAFARTHRLPLMAVAVKPGFSGTAKGADVPGFAPFDTVHADAGQAAALGLTTFPAVLLIPTPDAMARRVDFAILKGALAGRDGMLIAAGAVSGEELLRRITFLLQKGVMLAGLGRSTPFPAEVDDASSEAGALSSSAPFATGDHAASPEWSATASHIPALPSSGR